MNLLFTRCPTTVTRFIIAVVVRPAVNSRIWRAFAHVGEKVLKYIPPLTYFNTSSAVIFVGFMCWIIAPRFHRTPRIIGLRFLVDTCMSMFKASIWWQIRLIRFCFTTSARYHASALKPRATTSCLSSTSTAASPFSTVVIRYAIVATNYSKATKGLPDKIAELCHSTGIAYSVGMSRLMVRVL